MADVETQCGKCIESPVNFNYIFNYQFMIRHLFTLIWNKKKQNFLLMLEILVSFLVVFGVCSLMVYYYRSYTKPMGLDYEDVWVINYNNSLKTDNTDSLAMFYGSVKQTLKAMPEVKEVSYASDNYPFSIWTNGTGLSYNGKPVNNVNNFTVEDSYREVLNIKVLEGRWYNRQDASAKDKAVIINASLKVSVFGKENAVGKFLADGEGKHPMKVIGVVQDIKSKGDYTDIGNAVFSRVDTGAFHWLANILVKVTPDASAAFESRLYKTIASTMKNANVEIEHLSDKRRDRNNSFLMPLIVILMVAGFLIINVALGLFGVLWYNINRRKGEIGLRRAIGASGSSVAVQLVAEALILATLSLTIGSFFAIQFPLLHVGNIPPGVYLTALAISVLFIYLLVLLCSLYPGKQAAAVYPAVALHEE